MNYKYDFFISYAKANEEIAFYVVEKIEKRGYKCFIAPRNITNGSNYATELISAISNSVAVILIFSEQSDKSGYVLREINSAVSRNKTIIPLRIANFAPSEAMEFYLGVTHWLDAFPKVLDVHLDSIINVLNGIKGTASVDATNAKAIKVVGPKLMKIDEVLDLGFTPKQITMKETELDYICIPSDKFNMNEEVEGTMDDWSAILNEYEKDTSVLLIKNDEIIGYCDFYPVTPEAYDELISGTKIIRDNMIELYSLGGSFNAYIAMIAITPEHATQECYLMFFDWLIKHIVEWKKNDIIINNIGISVYSAMLEKFVLRFGFKFSSTNPANGKVFSTNIEELRNNSLVKSRYHDIDL